MSKRILVVEDQEDNRQIIRDMLAATEIHVLRAGSKREVEAAVATTAQLGIRALLINTDSFFNSDTEQLAELTLRQSLPALYSTREFAAAGGLVSYGASGWDLCRPHSCRREALRATCFAADQIRSCN